jgi:UDP-2-acetamido-2-deoxy-ribo-hexuluronate aminotransferase
MPVALYGQPADMNEINAIAARHGLAVIEDAAQSFGARYKGRWSGNLSTIGCTSFFPSKPLGCYGDGGAMFTNDDAIAQAMREIRVHGQSKRYVHTRIGVGGRMDAIQCAVVLAKLERFAWEIERRMAIGARYTELLAREAASKVEILSTRADRTNVHAQYTILAVDRGRLQEHLKAKGIPTAVHYPIPIHQQPAYRQFARGGLDVSERLADRVVSLPMHPDLTEDLQRFITTAVAESPLAG